MTHPHDPRVIQTNGIGARTTSHLNLDRSLADAGWTEGGPHLLQSSGLHVPPKPEPARKRIMSRPPGPREPRGIAYAGFDGGRRT